MSVLVPTFNRAAMLVECLESLLAQTVAPLEILVVDDGSSDDTARAATRFPAPVRYFRQENRGKPAALNSVLPEVRGEWVWFFDDDDVALPSAIENRLRVLENCPTAALVISPFLWGSSGEDGRIRAGERLRWPRLEGTRVYPALLRGPCAHLNGCLIRRQRLLSIGGFRPDLLAAEDYELLLRAARGAVVAVCEEPSFIFRQHGGDRGPSSQRYRAQERLLRFAEGDAEVGRWVRKSHALGEYLGMPADQELDAGARKHATIARLTAMAGKGLFLEVAEDCLALAQLIGFDCALDDETAAAVRSALQEDYLVLRATRASGELARAFSPLADSPVGRSMLRNAARGAASRVLWPSTRLRDRLALLVIAVRLAVLGIGARAVDAHRQTAG